MKLLRRAFTAAFVLLTFNFANGQLINQGASAPEGAILYSLPLTTVVMEVTADYESFVAGPYAIYAEKYLGIEARTESAESYTISTVKIYPTVEADPSVKVAINLGASKKASANFLNFSSQGLIMASEGYSGENFEWRFPSKLGQNAFDNVGATSNIDNKVTTLYKTVERAGGLERIPVQQSQIVEKSLEKKAEQTAALIFKLRQTRVDIITGNTDATYSGEAMGAALAEIERLESEYLSLFIGKSKRDVQSLRFEVTPEQKNERQIYIAFRVSDTQGLLPSSNMGGRPVLLELTPESSVATSAVDNKASGRIFYREPVVVTARLVDGQKELLQTRFPVYQLGTIRSFPADIAIK